MTAITTAVGGWTPPEIRHLAGPSDLAHAAYDYLRSNDLFADLLHDEERLRDLLELAFYGSMTPEEGRFPAFRLFVPGHKNHPRPQVLSSFSEPLPPGAAGVAALKRLVPAAGSRNHMLVVEERDGSWVCTGLASATPQFSSVAVGRREWHTLFPDMPWGLAIRVDGPGAIQINLSGFTLKLRGGKVLISTSVMALPQFRRLTSEIGVRLASSVGARIVSTEHGEKTQWDLPVSHLIEHIIANMQMAGHGGCLLFPGDTAGDAVNAKFQIDGPHLGSALCDFYRASAQCMKQDLSPDDFRAAVAAWQKGISVTIRTADALAMMSRIDGCVVLNRDLQATSFGSKLKPPNERQPLEKVHPLRHESVNDSDVRKLGTRNQSAFDFCRYVPNSVAIVVSQDGDVRVASSDDKSVTFVESLEASSIELPAW